MPFTNTTTRNRQRRRLRHTAPPTCHLCGQPLDWNIKWPDPMAVVADHTIPTSRGGTDHIENLTAIHARCNWTKGDTINIEGHNNNSGTLG